MINQNLLSLDDVLFESESNSLYTSKENLDQIPLSKYSYEYNHQNNDLLSPIPLNHHSDPLTFLNNDNEMLYTELLSLLAPSSINETVCSPVIKNTRKKTKRSSRKYCSVEKCTNLMQSNGKCKKHGGGKRCSIPGCDKSAQSFGVCCRHGGCKTCKVKGCTKLTQFNGLCKAHNRVQKNRKIINNATSL